LRLERAITNRRRAVILACGVVVTVTAFLWARCAVMRRISDVAIQTTSACGLAFESTVYKWGEIPQHTSVHKRFRFENVSARPVEITQVRQTCSCSKVQLDREETLYTPGDRGWVEISYDSGARQGGSEALVFVHTDAGAEGLARLTLEGWVRTNGLVISEPKCLRVGKLVPGASLTRHVRLHRPSRKRRACCTSGSLVHFF